PLALLDQHDRSFGDHLAGLAVARIAAADVSPDLTTAAAADEVEAKPTPGALGFGRPRARRAQPGQQRAHRSELGEGHERADRSDGPPGDDRRAEREVLAVAQLVAEQLGPQLGAAA